MAHKSDADLVDKSHNTARYFTENPQVAWVLLVATLVAGTFGYLQMPKRKDPLIPVRVAVAITPWPGAPAEKVEQLVTRKIEEKIASTSEVEKIESTSRNGVSVVQVTVRAARSAARAGARRTVVFNFPGALNPLPIARIVDQLAGFARAEGAEDIRPVRGDGFVAFDALSDLDREGWLAVVHRFESE